MEVRTSLYCVNVTCCEHQSTMVCLLQHITVGLNNLLKQHVHFFSYSLVCHNQILFIIKTSDHSLMLHKPLCVCWSVFCFLYSAHHRRISSLLGRGQVVQLNQTFKSKHQEELSVQHYNEYIINFVGQIADIKFICQQNSVTVCTSTKKEVGW